MKVLMQNRSTAFSLPGGDTVQMMKTKEYLEKLGVMVDISLEKEPDVTHYNLVHVFNVQDIAVMYSNPQILNAKRQGRPVALSTIYWNFSEHDIWKTKIDSEISTVDKGRSNNAVNAFLRKTFGIEIKRVSRLEALLQQARYSGDEQFLKSQQLASLLLADVLLPNAQAELDILRTDFKAHLKNAYIIPNAADSFFHKSDGAAFTKKYGLKDFVLCVGRIEHTKNQLFLIRAMKGLGFPLVVIGKQGSKSYFERCREEADKDVVFLEDMSHAELGCAYGAAKVHALPSWRETPGLVSLEAALAGCNIVVTNRGSTEEYFGDFAYYCEPDGVASIRNAIVKAYNAPRNAVLAKHVLENFTWEKAAEKTIVAYETVAMN
jgi:glycosyltransferase involved in cell wall biosynthesis